MVYILFISFVFILLFNLNLLYSIKLFSTKKQIYIFIAYLISTFFVMFLPFGMTVTDLTGDLRPKYSWILFSVLIIYIAVAFLIPTLYFSFKVTQKFSESELKKRWIFFNIGYIFYSLAFFGLILYTALNGETMAGLTSIQLIISLITLVFTILGGFFIYYGVLKSLNE